jgi:hypothetical protein
MSIWRNYHRTKARETLEKWRGLRHINRQANPGKGIDCIRLVLEVYFDNELLERKPLPNYPNTWGLASPENVMAAGLAAAAEFQRIPIADWQPEFGDLVVWKAGSQSNHIGIVADGVIWHVMTGGKVGPSPISPVKRRCQEALRLTKKGWRLDPADLNMKDFIR